MNVMEKLKYTVIKNKTQYKEYCNLLEGLVFSEKKTKLMKDEIDLLTVLIKVWQEEHSTLKELDPVELIEYLREENKLTQNDLAKILEVSKSLISEILSYQKGLSKEMIRKLAARFKMSQEAFNKEYKLKKEYANV